MDSTENNPAEVKGPKCTSESEELGVHQAALGSHKGGGGHVVQFGVISEGIPLTMPWNSF